MSVEKIIELRWCHVTPGISPFIPYRPRVSRLLEVEEFNNGRGRSHSRAHSRKREPWTHAVAGDQKRRLRSFIGILQVVRQVWPAFVMEVTPWRASTGPHIRMFVRLGRQRITDEFRCEHVVSYTCMTAWGRNPRSRALNYSSRSRYEWEKLD